MTSINIKDREKFDIAQGKQEWYAGRPHRINASEMGAILGVSPWLSTKRLIKQKVDEFYGRDTRIETPAMRWGIDHESDGADEYGFLYADAELAPGGQFTATVSYEDKEYKFGASPDRLVGDAGILEVKCPFKFRDDKRPVFASINDQPHYMAQVQTQLLVTGREWCDFYQWAPNGHKYERVELDMAYFDLWMPDIYLFWQSYQEAIDSQNFGSARDRLLHDDDFRNAMNRYRNAKYAMDKWSDELEQAKAAVLDTLSENDVSEIDCNGVSVTQVVRKGSVDYKQIARESYGDDMLRQMEDEHRRPDSMYYKFTVKES